MSISIIFIHVNNSSIILMCNEKRCNEKTGILVGFQFSYKLQYIEEYTNVNINLSNINKFILTFVS